MDACAPAHVDPDAFAPSDPDALLVAFRRSEPEPRGHPADHGRPGRPGDLADTGSASVGIGIAAGLLVLAGLAMVRFRTTRGRRH